MSPICPVHHTIVLLKDTLRSGGITEPACIAKAEQILALLNEIAAGGASPENLPAVDALVEVLAESDRNGAGFETGRVLKKTLTRNRELFEDHITSGNCLTGDCQKLTPAPCQMACPAGIDIPAYVTLIGQGRHDEAIEVIRRVNPFPWVCGLVCTRPCESDCVRGRMDTPVSIKFLKAYAAEQAMSAGTYQNPDKAPDKGEKVCIIGAGPGGMTAAYYLALKGYGVRVIESLPKAGGMLRVGIPRYRLPGEVIDRETAMIESLGVEFQFNTKFGWRIHMNQLKKEGFKAFLFTIGAHKCSPIHVPGENDYAEVYTAVSFLREVALGDREKPGDHVVVIGGGNVAIDSARTCIRMGSKEVHLVYRRSREEMPADEEEVEQAIEEGVKISFLTIPVEILGKDYSVNAMRFIQAKLVEVEGSKRKRPVPIEGSEFDMQVDTVISAVGQRIDHVIMSDLPDLKWTRWNTIEYNPVTMETSLPGLFAAGDAVSGPKTVIEAIAGGKRAAETIDRYLSGIPLPKIAPAPVRANRVACISATSQEKTALQRPEMPLLNINRRRVTFQQVELGYDEDTVRREARRCLRCDICIRCGKCVEVCRDMMGIEALKLGYLNPEETSETDLAITLEKCILCGACAENCPNGALTVADVDGERSLSLCGTELNRRKLVYCETCGEPLGTDRYLEFIQTRIDDAGLPTPQKGVCERCSRAVWANTGFGMITR
jgi:NADPH-dependent glutamate synthase beta subunit-like oxidoreductase/ferredoxin